MAQQTEKTVSFTSVSDTPIRFYLGKQMYKVESLGEVQIPESLVGVVKSRGYALEPTKAKADKPPAK